MTYRIADEPNEPRHRSKFVLTASGYFGDLDSDFNLEEAVGDDPEDLKYLLDGYRELKRLHDRQKETGQGVNCWELDFKSGLVPCDNCREWYPHVKEFALTCWCSKGLPYNVEVDV